MDQDQSNTSMKNRVTDLINICSEGLYEKEEIVAVTLLSAIAGQSVFLYGLPGTAKSLIARRLSHVFQDASHFEYLMQSFSTPEDVFGPVSIQELKNDNYLRKTDGYLPSVDFAFLDEIWKSSPAILNTLLTIINERRFRNNGKDEKVPLKALIAASNETPPANQGLEALYDRFIMRITVNPMQNQENFKRLLGDDPVSPDIEVPASLQLTHDEWENFPDEIFKVSISEEVFRIINRIRSSIDEFNEENPEVSIYVSDRRWQRIAFILKASAFLCDRNEVIPVDTPLFKHCLWTLDENRKQINEIIEICIKEFACANYEEIDNWISKYNDFENSVAETMFYPEDIYDTKEIAGKECFVLTSPHIVKNENDPNHAKIKVNIYIPIEYIGTFKSFTPFDENGKNESRVACNFNGTDVCEVTIQDKLLELGWEVILKNPSYIEWFSSFPPVKIEKGTPKDVSSELKSTFENECKDLLSTLEEIIDDTNSYVDTQKELNDNPFVPAEMREMVLDAFATFLNNLENHKLNAEHLLEKVQSHAAP